MILYLEQKNGWYYMASDDTKTVNKVNMDDGKSFGEKIVAVLLCIHRTNVRTVVTIPAKIKSFVLRKINDYKNKPKRTEMNKVYVLVGYTTKQNVDNRYNDEHFLISVRRVLLILISILLLFITIKWLTPQLKFDQMKQIFGIQNVEDMTSNDPFSNESAPTISSESMLVLDNEEQGG